MSWAMVGAAAIAAVGGIVSSKQASKGASGAGGKELAFAEAQYEDWLDAFGDIQDNLARYYEELTPTFIETQGLEAFEREKDLALTNMREDFEQRGIATSGLAVDFEKDVEFASASERAKIRAEAPLRAAEEQAKFLQIGLGQDPSGGVQQVLSNQAASARGDAAVASANAGRAVSNLAETTFSALEKRFASTGNGTGTGGNTGGTGGGGAA